MLDPNILQRSVLLINVNLVKFVKEFKTLNNLTEDGMLLEVIWKLIFGQSNEKCRRVQVWPQVRGCNQSFLVEFSIQIYLIFEVFLF